MTEQDAVDKFRPMTELIARQSVEKYGARYEYDDLLAAALFGLLTACRKYEPARSQFSTYAFHCMQNSIRQAVRSNTGVIHVPYKSGAEREQAPLIRVNLTDSQWEICNMDDSNLDHVEQKVMLDAAMRDLTEAQQEIITMYFLKDMTYEEIAQARGVSKQAVHQVAQEALAILRNKLTA